MIIIMAIGMARLNIHLAMTLISVAKSSAAIGFSISKTPLEVVPPPPGPPPPAHFEGLVLPGIAFVSSVLILMHNFSPLLHVYSIQSAPYCLQSVFTLLTMRVLEDTRAKIVVPLYAAA